MKVLTIFGTRPEAVKLAPVVLEMQRRTGFDSLTCVTAQHRELLDQVNSMFGIRPDFDLDLMRENQSLSALTARVFSDLPSVFEQVKPDWVLVQGDTTTVMAAALTAFYHRVRVGHVEAGLRTYDKWQPFPEEVNRKVAGVVADLHFAPTEIARQNLLAEGAPPEAVHVTGNTIIDALQAVASQPFDREHSAVKQVPDGRRLVLVTAHRRENFGQPLSEICRAIRTLAEDESLGLHFVYPVHPNPNVTEVVYPALGECENITLLEPVDYRTLIDLMSRSSLVLTDSGGIQEEAPAFGVPVLVMRAVTERPEGIEAGVAKLVGADYERIVAEATRLIRDPAAYAGMSKAVNPYGDGQAARRIVDLLEAHH
jgi:UDP-N-acetylglucosamine 2-epimerase (non-hydrolysing)